MLAFLNSYLIEYLFRIGSSNNHINNYEINNFPFLDNRKDFENLGIFINDYLDKNHMISRLLLENKVLKIFKLEKFMNYLTSQLNLKKEIYENFSKNHFFPNFLYNHQSGNLSEIDLKMIKNVPSGGNWKNIPKSIPSSRLEQIRKTGGRTTYYGRLVWDKPSYTITTYFNRPGNGCNMHPDDNNSKEPQNRLLSLREAARLQSFPDRFRFFGSMSSIYKQIGNAVPPLLAYTLAKQFNISKVIDLFSGCGGLSYGFELAGKNVIAGVDNNANFLKTWSKNHEGKPILGDITKPEIKEQIYDFIEQKNQKIDMIIGGPPCQGFSTAGWRKDDDPRNKLWIDYSEITAALKPKYILMENVPGMISASNKGLKVFNLLKGHFNTLGYRVKYHKINASHYGVPQLRKRVFIIGIRNDLKFDFEFPKKIISKPLTVRDAIFGLPKLTYKDGAEIMPTNEMIPITTYQKWLMGEINTEKLIMHFRKNEEQQTLF